MRRSRLETMNVILTLCTRDIKKTHIMYRANLSHKQLEKYLEILVSKELLMRKNGYYATTDKGLDYIAGFKNVQSLMGEITSPTKTFY